MKRLSILGVCQNNDSYPNTKYKIELLKQMPDLQVTDLSYHFGDTGFSRHAGNHSLKKLFSALGFLWAHFISLIRAIQSRKADIWYIPYPGIFLLWLLPLTGRKKRKAIYLDAFISIYDTAIIDRKLLSTNSLLAKMLFKIERTAFLNCTQVIVDTRENAEYLSRLFDIEQHRFIDIPLCIPPVINDSSSPGHKTDQKFTCVFVGTFVPLQGVPVIVDAADQFKPEDKVEIVLIGDGQDAPIVDSKMKQKNISCVTWHRGHFDSHFIATQIKTADVCLGVFAESEKTQRVLPFKLYHYLAYGKPIISGQTKCLERLQQQGLPYTPVITGDSADLKRAILKVKENLDLNKVTSTPDFFTTCLSNDVITKQLRNLFFANESNL